MHNLYGSRACRALSGGLKHVHGALSHPGAPLYGKLLVVESMQNPDWEAAHDREG